MLRLKTYDDIKTTEDDKKNALQVKILFRFHFALPKEKEMQPTMHLN